jgi:hypothetical protein
MIRMAKNRVPHERRAPERTFVAIAASVKAGSKRTFVAEFAQDERPVP